MVCVCVCDGGGGGEGGGGGGNLWCRGVLGRDNQILETYCSETYSSEHTKFI